MVKREVEAVVKREVEAVAKQEVGLAPETSEAGPVFRSWASTGHLGGRGGSAWTFLRITRCLPWKASRPSRPWSPISGVGLRLESGSCCSAGWMAAATKGLSSDPNRRESGA